MLSFTSKLSPDAEALAIFVNDKYVYKDRIHILPDAMVQQIDSFIGVLRARKRKDDISFLDISEKQKCFIIKVKN